MRMRRAGFHRLWMAAAVILFVISAHPHPAETQPWETVRWVDDGDTVVLESGSRVRYIGINAPEVAHEDRPAEPYGNAAKKHNLQLVYRKQIRLEFDRDKKDRHGRVLAYVFLRNGCFVNAEMVREGYAHTLFHRENDRYHGLLLKTQRQAMAAGKGMWRNRRESGIGYIGNRNSKRFHLKDCPFAKQTARKNRVYFQSMWEAFWAGFAPAKGCLREYWK